MTNHFSEKQLEKIWQNQLLVGRGLVTAEGEPVDVIFPGRRNDEPGADFRDAVLATRQGLMKGDVELHLKSSGWWEHGHHQDATYNRVILHVVMWHNSARVTRLQNGRAVPVVALDKQLSHGHWSDRGSSAFKKPCLNVPQRWPAEVVARLLDKAGEERFLIKTARFEADFARMGVGQSLYQGIMGALGYTRNKLPFLELARILPLSVLEAAAPVGVTDTDYLLQQQALLLGTAGLSSSFSHGQAGNRLSDALIGELERRWYASGRTGVMPVGTWHFLGIRPNNSPVRRLVAMSYLLLRFRAKGMLEEMIARVSAAPVGREGCRGLEDGLLVTAGGEWASSFANGLEKDDVTLLGRGRASDIVVNIVLPFALAWSRLTGQPDLGAKALALYYHYPGLAGNSVVKQVATRLGLNLRLHNSAQRQQGLIHIYNTLCSPSRCYDCVLAGS